MISLNTPNKLPPKIKWYWLTIIISSIFILSLPLLFLNKGIWFLFFCLVIIFLGTPVFIYFLLYYKYFSFIVGDNKMTINSGIIIKCSKTIAFDKIQSVNVVRGIMARLFGLSSVNIWTASPSQINLNLGTKETFQGSNKPDGSLELDTGDGEWLKNFIFDKNK